MYDPVEVSLAASKAREALENSGQVGHAEKNSITWNGDTSGGIGALNMCHVSDESFSAEQLVAVIVTIGNGTFRIDWSGSTVTADDGTVTTISSPYLVAGEETPGTLIVAINTQDDPIAVSLSADFKDGDVLIFKKGTSFASTLFGGYISSIELKETIHPINQKFIPPLDSLTLNGADGKQYKLSVDESGQLVTAVVE